MTPKNKKKKPHPKKSAFQKAILKWQKFFQQRPLLGYIGLTLILMGGVYIAERGAELYKASLLEVPQFDGTIMPVQEVPNWKLTGGKNDRPYRSYASTEFIDLPVYDPAALKTKCAQNDPAYTNACITYSTVYMGNYHMDHKEYAGSHIAIDIRMPEGTPISAVANGVVTKAVQKPTGFGRYIVIKHPDAPDASGKKQTLYSAYAHMSELKVREGQVVKKGDLIGYSGSSGTSTTPHLHFQVDTDSAPYHPWWPFSSAQASAANLTFFSAINEGLGQAEGEKNTINPMLWVQSQNSGESPVTAQKENIPKETSSDNTHTAAPTLKGFTLQASENSVHANDPVTFSLHALDEEGNIFTEYTGENLTVISSDENALLSAPQFVKGKSEIKATFPNTGNVKIAVRDGNISKSIKLSVTTPRDISLETEVIKIEPETIAIDRILFDADKTALSPGERVNIRLSALDAEGNTILRPDLKNSTLKVGGVGRLSPTTLKKEDFTNGVATLTFISSEAGSSEISLENFSETFEIEVIDEVKNIHHFTVESDRNFIVGEKEEITIKTRDVEDRVTPKNLRHTAKISLISGKGKLSETELTADDFHDGIANITILPTTSENIILKVQSGVLVGTSESIRAEKKRETEKTPETETVVFSDISKNNPNYAAIALLKKKGIIKGNPDGSFRPNAPINRAEFAKILLLALNKEVQNPRGNIFTDVPAESWFAPFAETAASYGIIKGYPNGNFGAGNNINRAELFVMLSRSLENKEYGSSSFADVPADAWFANAAAFAQENDLLDFGSSFLPSKAMTRAEVAEAVARFLEMRS